MIRRPPRSTRTDTLFPYTTLFRSHGEQPALVYAGDFYGNFYAIDAASGTLRWSRFIGTEKDHHTITGAPQVYDGKLIVPVSSKEVLSALFELRPCCSSHGLLQALDPYRSEERRVGKECVSTCRSRGAPDH